MVVRISEKAYQQLAQVQIQGGRALRISAEFEGEGCACNLMYHLSVDVPSAEDIVSTAEVGVPVAMSRSTIEWVGEHASLDYLDNVGFVLANPEQTLAYGVKFRK